MLNKILFRSVGGHGKELTNNIIVWNFGHELIWNNWLIIKKSIDAIIIRGNDRTKSGWTNWVKLWSTKSIEESNVHLKDQMVDC